MIHLVCARGRPSVDRRTSVPLQVRFAATRASSCAHGIPPVSGCRRRGSASLPPPSGKPIRVVDCRPVTRSTRSTPSNCCEVTWVHRHSARGKHGPTAQVVTARVVCPVPRVPGCVCRWGLPRFPWERGRPDCAFTADSRSRWVAARSRSFFSPSWFVPSTAPTDPFAGPVGAGVWWCQRRVMSRSPSA